MPEPEQDRALAGLMKAAQGGDTAAYAQLLRTIIPLVRNAVRRAQRYRDPADIEDMVQDVLLSLHAVRGTYDPERPFIPWLLTIARNRSIDAARRSIRRAAHEIQVDELPVTFADDATNNELEGYGDPEALKVAIAALPHGQRKAVEMLKLREMSLKDAADATGMSIAALKVSMHRAMASLMRAMAKG
jgi:RNA polymerase sigma-70 factor (ECF subfamily)